MAKKGVVLLFGTFNPFTNAHLNIGHIAKENYPDYDIFYVPAKAKFMSEYKGLNCGDILSEDNRLDMIRGSIEGTEDFYVTDVEFGGIVDGKTMNTIAYFKEELGYEDVVLCFGTDKISELEFWYRGRELVSDNKFLIITRDGNSLDSVMTEYTRMYRGNFREVKNDTFSSLSGSLVRKAIENGDRDFVKKSVPEYVYHNFFD